MCGENGKPHTEWRAGNIEIENSLNLDGSGPSEVYCLFIVFRWPLLPRFGVVEGGVDGGVSRLETGWSDGG